MQLIATCQRKFEGVTFLSLLWNSHLTKGCSVSLQIDVGGPRNPLWHKKCTKMNIKLKVNARRNVLIFPFLNQHAKLFPSKKCTLQVQSLFCTLLVIAQNRRRIGTIGEHGHCVAHATWHTFSPSIFSYLH